MSIDARVLLFVPMGRATDALEAARRCLLRRKSILGIQGVSPGGTTIRIPAEALGPGPQISAERSS